VSEAVCCIEPFPAKSCTTHLIMLQHDASLCFWLTQSSHALITSLAGQQIIQTVMLWQHAMCADCLYSSCTESFHALHSCVPDQAFVRPRLFTSGHTSDTHQMHIISSSLFNGPASRYASWWCTSWQHTQHIPVGNTHNIYQLATHTTYTSWQHTQHIPVGNTHNIYQLATHTTYTRHCNSLVHKMVAPVVERCAVTHHTPPLLLGLTVPILAFSTRVFVGCTLAACYVCVVSYDLCYVCGHVCSCQRCLFPRPVAHCSCALPVASARVQTGAMWLLVLAWVRVQLLHKQTGSTQLGCCLCPLASLHCAVACCFSTCADRTHVVWGSCIEACVASTQADRQHATAWDGGRSLTCASTHWHCALPQHTCS
jgi:hypothetical protein